MNNIHSIIMFFPPADWRGVCIDSAYTSAACKMPDVYAKESEVEVAQ